MKESNFESRMDVSRQDGCTVHRIIGCKMSPVLICPNKFHNKGREGGGDILTRELSFDDRAKQRD